jgi:hypothetical protein
MWQNKADSGCSLSRFWFWPDFSKGFRAVLALAIMCVTGMACALCAQETPSPPMSTLKPDCPAEWLQKIEDDEPVRSAKDNKAEHDAYYCFVKFARKQSVGQLAQNVRKDLTSLNLASSERKGLRGELIHIDGRLKRLVKISSDEQDKSVGDIYEAWIFEKNNPNPVAVILSELPPDLKPDGDVNRLVAIDGFFFKRYKYPVADGGFRLAPLLIGKALTKNDPAPEEAPPEKVEPIEPTKMDCPRLWLTQIQDDEPVMAAKDNLDEYNAYNYFVDFARKQSLEDLAKHSRREVTWRNLWDDGRAEFRGEIVHVEGRLGRLDWIGPTEDLKAQGFKNLYQAWIFPPAYGSNPTVVVFTELPPGIEPTGDKELERWKDHNKWVAADGYFFKRYKYRSEEKDEKGRNIPKGAPLIIGRSLTVSTMPVETESSQTLKSYSKFLVPLGIVLAVLMIVVALVLGRFFRQGDKQVQARLAKVTGSNPFEQPVTPFPDEPPTEPPPPNRLFGDPSEN